jgi:pyruvate formate lyase activating enzyme
MRVENSLTESINGKLRCLVCNHKCIIPEGGKGVCKAKMNQGGRLYSTAYSIIIREAVEPIEQKPLFHFRPNTTTYSIGGLSCNFDCPWCQDWNEISDFLLTIIDPDSETSSDVTPERVIEKASDLGVDSITYTYNEPSIGLEFIRDTATLGMKKGIRNILVTNGYYSQEALQEYKGFIDAVNIDIKAFNEEFYHRYPKADLLTILDTAKKTKQIGIHVELTMLIIPTLNDNMEDIQRFISWVRDEMGQDTPVYFSRFFPKSKFNYLPLTPVSILNEAREAALKAGLNYVYIWNVPGFGEDTFCPGCKEKVIGRKEYHIMEWDLDEESRCNTCGTKISIVQ